MRLRLRTLALLAALVLLAAACGQKANVGDETVAAGDGFSPVAGADGSGGDLGGDLGDGTGDGGDLGGDGGGTGTGTAGTAGGGGGGSTAGSGGTGGGGGGTGGGTGGGSGGGSGGGGTPAAGDRTGITDEEIVIGIHAPVSGAAPFPQTSFEEGAAVYWDHLSSKGGVFGRRVRVVFEDDEFNPATAKRVCQKMVTQDKVFLLIGGGGADQITACANYANSVGVPYLSAGVNEEGLNNIRAYFALSMTYAQQSPMLAQLAARLGTKLGIAVADTPSFEDAHASFERAAREAGLDIVYNDSIPKNASQAEALSVANEMRASGAEVVYFLASPTTFLNISSAAAGQGYRPKYIGPGITSGLQIVAQVGCANNSIPDARFLSPFPQLDVIDQLDPEYQQAYRETRGSDGDDIGIALWGLAKTLHRMFEAAGEDMTRQSFVQTLESGTTFESGVYPPVQYSSSNHLGGSQAHVLRADCGARAFVTETQFASSL